MKPSFEDLQKWIHDYWGLTLHKANPDNHGYFFGDWKSGYIVSGSFPGLGYQHRRYNTLKEIARIFEYNKHNLNK